MSLMLDETQKISIPANAGKVGLQIQTIAWNRFFAPGTNWEWFVTKFLKRDSFYGFMKGDYWQWKYFTLTDLDNLGFSIMHDVNFKPLSIIKIMYPKEVCQVCGESVHRSSGRYVNRYKILFPYKLEFFTGEYVCSECF